MLSLPIVSGTPAGASHAHMLVDCGVHHRGDAGTLEAAVRDIAKITGRQLAVVIATHAHEDHIAGFGKCGDLFSTFRIGEVWLPWTWDTANPEAVKLQRKQMALASQLVGHFAALSARVARGSPVRTQLAAAAGAAANADPGRNAHAISLLQSGFGVTSRIRYLKAGDMLPGAEAGVSSVASAVPIPGLATRILGPPQSQEFLARMNPPAGNHYLAMTPRGVRVTNAVAPFAGRWRLNDKASELAHLRLSRPDAKALRNEANDPLVDLAFALDQARNNESVVALFVYRGQYLLFPGDAQFGNWQWWLENEQPENILPHITFFKVAHHGSMNATPKDALEQMATGEFAAMVSTQSTPWPSIPQPTLMARLGQKASQRLVRSDWLSLRGAPGPSRDAQPPQPPNLPTGFTQGPFWFDYLFEI